MPERDWHVPRLFATIPHMSTQDHPHDRDKSIRSMPCSTCPYRRDVPSGIWAHHTYEMLRPYDNDTPDQPFAPFGCHATPEFFCHGWAVVGGVFGPKGLLALRMARVFDVGEPGVPLFSSHSEAADHGQREIEAPSIEARMAVERLTDKYDRIREANP